jgi:hypothetical protein
MGPGFDDCIYWHFFTFATNYNSSHTELLNDVCPTNLYEEPLTALNRPNVESSLMSRPTQLVGQSILE